MFFHKITAGCGRRAVRPPVLRRSVEALERRDLLALVLTPLSLTEDSPFSGKVATFAAADLQGTATDFKPAINWGDGTTATGTASNSTGGTAEIVPEPDGLHYDVVALSKTYTQFGTFPVTVTVAGTNNSVVSASGSATVADATLTPQGTTFVATAGQFFSGVVGGFQDNNTASTNTDFTITINWGDGQTSLGAAALAPASGQMGAQRYNVTGSHVYGATGTDTVTLTIIRSSSGQTATTKSTADVIAPGLTLFPATVSGIAGTALGTSTTTSASGTPTTTVAPVTVATLVDASTSSKQGDFTATIQWGQGLPTTTASVTAIPNMSGEYTVTGTFTYPATGIYYPLVTVVRTTLNQTVNVTSTANITAALAPAGSTIPPATPVAFTGILDPTSNPTPYRGLLATNQQEPTLSGTAAPGATIDLFIRHQGRGNPIDIGETLAGTDGRWSLIVGPLGGSPFYLYGVATPVANPPSPITLLNNGIPILVTNRLLPGQIVPLLNGQAHRHAVKTAVHHHTGHGKG